MSIPKKQSRSVSLPSVEDMVRDLVDDPDQWLDTENDQLLPGSWLRYRVPATGDWIDFP